MAGPFRRIQWLALGALTLGSAINLAAGARRPLVERAILRADHYPAADAAARAVERHVPPGARVDLVVYDQDLLDELDCAVWADYRLKWLLYPRKPEVYRWSPTSDPQPDSRYTELGVRPVRSPDEDRYLLFFRVTAPPERSRGPLKVLESSPHFILAREPAHAAFMSQRVPNVTAPSGTGES